MKASQIQVGHVYEIQSGRNKTTVKVTSFNERTGGWNCETGNGKSIPVKNFARFLKEILPESKKSTKIDVRSDASKIERKKGGKPKGRMSGLDAAYEILKKSGKPMNVKEITDAIIASSLWNPEGATPSATISAALQREIAAKQEDSRFVKAERGLFAAR